jgi:hypothetical protein
MLEDQRTGLHQCLRRQVRWLPDNFTLTINVLVGAEYGSGVSIAAGSFGAATYASEVQHCVRDALANLNYPTDQRNGLLWDKPGYGFTWHFIHPRPAADAPQRWVPSPRDNVDTGEPTFEQDE